MTTMAVSTIRPSAMTIENRVRLFIVSPCRSRRNIVMRSVSGMLSPTRSPCLKPIARKRMITIRNVV